MSRFVDLGSGASRATAMRPFIRAGDYRLWHGGNGCQYNFPNFGIGEPRPQLTGRSAGGSHGRFFPPHVSRWPQMLRGAPTFPWAGHMLQTWRLPPMPVYGPRCSEQFSRDHSSAPTTSRRRDGDNSNREHAQHVRSEGRSNASEGRQRTGSQSVRDAENRCSTCGRFKTDRKRKMHKPRKRSRNNQYRRARSHSSRSSSLNRVNRGRERRRSHARSSRPYSRSRAHRGQERRRSRARSSRPHSGSRVHRGRERRRSRARTSRPYSSSHVHRVRERRRSRERSSRPYSSSSVYRERERRRSRAPKYEARSRDDRKGRKRARTRSCSPYEPSRRKRAECRTRVRATSRDAREERKRSRQSTARLCILPHSKKSAAAEPQEMAVRSAGKHRAADGSVNASYSIAASSNKDVPRKEDFSENESTSSNKYEMLATLEVTPPQVSLVAISPGDSHVGSRVVKRGEAEEGLGAEFPGEDSDNVEKPFVGPSTEDNNQTPCSESQQGSASPDSAVTLLQMAHTSERQPYVVIRAEGEKNQLAVSSREESAPTASVESNGEGVNPEATFSDGDVGEDNSIGPGESIETSALPRGSRCPPSDLGKHIEREIDQVHGTAKHLAFSSNAEDKCVEAEGEAEKSGTLTPAHVSNDSHGEVLAPELHSMLRKTGPDTTEAFFQWLKSLTAPNNADCSLKHRCERQDPLADFGASTEASQEQPADTGVSTQAPVGINVQMASTSAATCVDIEAPSTSRTASFSVDIDRDKETESIASTPTLDDEVLEASTYTEPPEEFDPQVDCFIPCTPDLSASPGSFLPSQECSLPRMRPRINAADFPALASVEEKFFYESDTQTACLILDLLRDEQKKSQVLSLYEEGLHTDQRAAYSAQMRMIVFDALENQPPSRRSFVRKLRKFADFRWATNLLP